MARRRRLWTVRGEFGNIDGDAVVDVGDVEQRCAENRFEDSGVGREDAGFSGGDQMESGLDVEFAGRRWRRLAQADEREFLRVLPAAGRSHDELCDRDGSRAV